MRTPKSIYDLENNKVNQDKEYLCVWCAILDLRYKIEVQRDSDYAATLVIFDGKDNDKIILEKEVSLAYGARFGPDIDDLTSWQNIACACIDGLTTSQ
jgi:hypothetical protein